MFIFTSKTNHFSRIIFFSVFQIKLSMKNELEIKPKQKKKQNKQILSPFWNKPLLLKYNHTPRSVVIKWLNETVFTILYFSPNVKKRISMFLCFAAKKIRCTTKESKNIIKINVAVSYWCSRYLCVCANECGFCGRM